MLGAAVAINVDNSWNKAMNGSVQGAAEVQQFVDRAAAGGVNEILAKITRILTRMWLSR
jgi:cell division protein FtsN